MSVLKLTRTLRGEVRNVSTFHRLYEAQRFTAYSLHDNGVLAKREAQQLASTLTLDNPIAVGDYAYSLELADNEEAGS